MATDAADDDDTEDEPEAKKKSSRGPKRLGAGTVLRPCLVGAFALFLVGQALTMFLG